MTAPALDTKMAPCPRCGSSNNASWIFCYICGMRLSREAKIPETVQVPLTPTSFSASSPGTTLLTYDEHSGAVFAVAWSSDARLLASASEDKIVQVGGESNGKRGLIYEGHSDMVYAVAWSPGGRFLTSASGDKSV